jgi:hypothetical protein
VVLVWFIGIAEYLPLIGYNAKLFPDTQRGAVSVVHVHA